MAGFIKVEAEKIPVKALNMQVNKNVFNDFKIKCKERRLPLNIVIETFMNQYANRKYTLNYEDVIKWRESEEESEILSSTFSKEVYTRFRNAVKEDKLFIKHVVSAFMEDYIKNDLIIEFVKMENKK